MGFCNLYSGESLRKGNQYWYYRSDGQLGRDLQCVVARPEHSQEQNAVALGSCGQEPGWDYDPRLALLQHRLSGLCLRVTRYSCCFRDSEVMTTSLLCRTPLQLWLVECNKADTQQKWFFTNFEENGIPDIGESEDDALQEVSRLPKETPGLAALTHK